MGISLADQIDAVLPQTQCRRCQYPACRPYAQAIAEGLADINQCPPGGQRGIDAIAALLGVASKPLNPEHGVEQPAAVAVITETECIGCVKCIQACPVDAILGASRQMHTVLVAECTGCELCIEPCPVDYIAMHPVSVNSSEDGLGSTRLKQKKADLARSRYYARIARIERENAERAEKARKKKAALQQLKAMAVKSAQ